MADRELLEWLGLTLADLLVYLAAGAIIAMYFVSNPTADITLAVLGIGLTFVSCPIGMKHNPEVSAVTSAIKLVTYPICVLLAVAAVVAHYVAFDR